MSEIQVTSGTVRSKAEELRGLNSNFKSACDELTSTEGTLRAEYVGDASDAFHAAYTRNSVKWEQFHTAIEQYCTKLEEIAQKYESAEASAVSIVS